MPPRMQTTGVPQLDAIMGGLPQHGLTMILGAPGAGKTVMAVQIALHRARLGDDVVFLTAYSESHEKITEHMDGFSFFDADLVGERVTMLSLKSSLKEGSDRTLETVVRAARDKQAPLIVLDGYRGLREALGAEGARELVSSLSTQLPYLGASVIITTEGEPHDPNHFAESTSADALLALYHVRQDAQALRTLEILKVRGSGYSEGFHGFTITTDGITVYPRLASCLPPSTFIPTSQRCGFGLPEFDSMLRGGVPRYSTTLLSGEPGTGRTTFSLHFVLDGARRGEQGLLIAMRDTAADLLHKCDELGLDLRSQVASGAVDILEGPAVELNPYSFAWAIRERLEQAHPTRLVIDTISNIEGAPAVREFDQGFLAGLHAYLRRSGVTTLLTADTPALPSWGVTSTSSAQMSMAHNRVELRRVAVQGNLHRLCTVMTMERSDHDTSMREFSIGQGGICMLTKEESVAGVFARTNGEQPPSTD